MARGFKTGGRTKGTPNKKTLDVIERLEQLNCDPIEGMAKIAMDQSNPPELRGRMFSELAQYVVPKRKAIEHSTDGSSGQIVFSWLSPSASPPVETPDQIAVT